MSSAHFPHLSFRAESRNLCGFSRLRLWAHFMRCLDYARHDKKEGTLGRHDKRWGEGARHDREWVSIFNTETRRNRVFFISVPLYLCISVFDFFLISELKMRKSSREDGHRISETSSHLIDLENYENKYSNIYK